MVSVEVGMSRLREKKAGASLYHMVPYTLLFCITHLNEAAQVSGTVHIYFFLQTFLIIYEYIPPIVKELCCRSLIALGYIDRQSLTLH